MVDWNLARRLADQVAGSPPEALLPGDLSARCEDAATRVAAYARLTPASALPPPEAVDRHLWLELNLAGMQATLDPLLERALSDGPAGAGPVRAAGGAVIAVEVGALSGYLARRVLGQYELQLLDPDYPPRLLFVAPNLADAANALDADLDELLSWVAFHEVTHAVQFAGVPWLRAHVAGMLTELVASLELKLDLKNALSLPSLDDLRGLGDRLREGGLVTAVAGPERRAILDRIQAVMALIEGHAEHVMDSVGESVLPNLPALRSAMNRRRADRSPLVRLLERLIGLDMKLAQYETGKAFCDAVVKDGGIQRLNIAWTAPELLPTAAELKDPPQWLERTRVPAVTSG
ncbi:MAG: coenzyme F420 biosynthesis protein [Actinobacteria bacterium]|nr:MAG: coenzyme F420 biosynthesis protein [Actinomycetota bacterium]